MSKSVAHSIGSFVGTTAAYAWEGSGLASTQFAAGAAEGYAAKAAELRARREALLAAAGVPPVEAVQVAKVRVARAKA